MEQNHSGTSLGLLVLRVADMDRALDFYQTFGLKFEQEKHGNGPVHYSCQLGQTVLELYPGSSGVAPDRKNAGSTTIGFQVADIHAVLDTLQQKGITILTPVQSSVWGQRAVVQDPDGRAIELNQPLSTNS